MKAIASLTLPSSSIDSMESDAGKAPRATRIATLVLGALLGAATVTAWSVDRWPRYGLQAGIFVLAFVLSMQGRAREIASPRWLLCLPMAPALCGLAQLALRTTVYPFATVEAATYWGALACVVYCGLVTGAASEVRTLLMSVLLVTALAATLVEVVQLFSGPELAAWVGADPASLEEPVLSSNRYAELIELALPVALVRALLHRRHWLPGLGLAAVFCATVIASGARMGSLLCVLEVVVVFWLIRRRHLVPTRHWWKTIAAVALVAGVFVATEGSQSLVNRLKDKRLTSGRGDIVASALEMAVSRPVLGYGLGTFATVYPTYARFDNGYFVNHAHNDWLETAAEAGFGCLVVFLMLAGRVVRPAVDSLWGIGVLAILIHALVDFPFQRLDVAGWTLWLSAAVVARSVSTSLRNKRSLMTYGRRHNVPARQRN